MIAPLQAHAVGSEFSLIPSLSFPHSSIPVWLAMSLTHSSISLFQVATELNLIPIHSFSSSPILPFQPQWVLSSMWVTWTGRWPPIGGRKRATHCSSFRSGLSQDRYNMHVGGQVHVHTCRWTGTYIHVGGQVHTCRWTGTYIHVGGQVHTCRRTGTGTYM